MQLTPKTRRIGWPAFGPFPPFIHTCGCCDSSPLSGHPMQTQNTSSTKQQLRTYSITTRRMISARVLKYLNGECVVIQRGYKASRHSSSSSFLVERGGPAVYRLGRLFAFNHRYNHRQCQEQHRNYQNLVVGKDAY